MRILWLQDFDIFSYPGGAEMNDAAHFAAGLRRGHEIKQLHPEMPFWQPDCLIVSNVVSFDKQRLKTMVESSKTVIFMHDYIFCKYRLFYPMLEKCKLCNNVEIWKDILLKAKLIIWLSPLHRDLSLFAIPELKDMPYALVPSAINPDRFLVENEIREDAYLSVNSLYPFKGRDAMLNYISKNQDKKFYIVTSEKLDVVPGNVTLLPPTTYDEMPKLYSRFKYYIELPTTPQPFNRTVVEAKLAGCQIITNKLMGAASWPWFDSMPKNIAAELRRAPDDFWNAIEGVIK